MNLKTYKIHNVMVIESHYYNVNLLEVQVLNENGQIDILIHLDTERNREKFLNLMKSKRDYTINTNGFKKEREIVRDLGYCNIYYHSEVVDILQ